jgi:hypothetical protein
MGWNGGGKAHPTKMKGHPVQGLGRRPMHKRQGRRYTRRASRDMVVQEFADWLGTPEDGSSDQKTPRGEGYLIQVISLGREAEYRIIRVARRQ